MSEIEATATANLSASPEHDPSLVMLTVLVRGEYGTRIEHREGWLDHYHARDLLSDVQQSIEAAAPRILRRAVELQQGAERVRAQEQELREKQTARLVQQARDEAGVRGHLLAQEIRRLLGDRHLTKKGFEDAIARFDRG